MKPISRLRDPYYRSLVRNMVLIVIVVSFTPMILAGGIILNQFHKSYREKVEEHLRELVLKHRQNIDSFLLERLSNIRFLSDGATFAQLSDESYLQERLAHLQKDYNNVFVDLGLVNREGIQIAYAGPFKLVNARYSEADWFKKAMRSKTYISDVFLGLRELPHFIVTVRRDWNGNDYVLRATIDFMAFNSLVENLRIGRTGFAYILNKNKEFQTKTPDLILPHEGVLSNFSRYNMEDGETINIAELTDHAGKKIVYATAFLKNGDWMLVYQQDAGDIFTDLLRTRLIALLIFVLGGLGIITMSLLLSRRIVGRIAQSDREKELMNQQVIETGKLASIGELAAGIAHEINNPVAIMVEEAGWIEDLLEEEDLQEGENLGEFRRALNQIKNQGRRCKEITHKLLSFARKTDSRVQDIQVNEVIEEVVELSSQRAKYSNVTIQTTLQTGLPSVRMSMSELQQVLFNLINNALDAMEKTGGIIRVLSRMKDQRIEIAVEDNGPGIPRAILGRIFDPFFTTKPVGKGTGLGLSICYGIIKKMGGEIDVRSVVDAGTSFCIRLPSSSRDRTDPEIRGQRSEIRGQKLETGDPEP